MCSILDFLERKKVGIYQTWFLESIINIKSPAITHAFSICCILHPKCFGEFPICPDLCQAAP